MRYSSPRLVQLCLLVVMGISIIDYSESVGPLRDIGGLQRSNVRICGSGQFLVRKTVVVTNTTLTIQGGAKMMFSPNVGIVVNGTGKLIIEDFGRNGYNHRARFSCYQCNVTERWAGVRVLDGGEVSSFSHVSMEQASVGLHVQTHHQIEFNITQCAFKNVDRPLNIEQTIAVKDSQLTVTIDNVILFNASQAISLSAAGEENSRPEYTLSMTSIDGRELENGGVQIRKLKHLQSVYIEMRQVKLFGAKEVLSLCQIDTSNDVQVTIDECELGNASPSAHNESMVQIGAACNMNLLINKTVISPLVVMETQRDYNWKPCPKQRLSSLTIENTRIVEKESCKVGQNCGIEVNSPFDKVVIDNFKTNRGKFSGIKLKLDGSSVQINNSYIVGDRNALQFTHHAERLSNVTIAHNTIGVRDHGGVAVEFNRQQSMESKAMMIDNTFPDSFKADPMISVTKWHLTLTNSRFQNVYYYRDDDKCLIRVHEPTPTAVRATNNDWGEVDRQNPDLEKRLCYYAENGIVTV